MSDVCGHGKGLGEHCIVCEAVFKTQDGMREEIEKLRAEIERMRAALVMIARVNFAGPSTDERREFTWATAQRALDRESFGQEPKTVADKGSEP